MTSRRRAHRRLLAGLVLAAPVLVGALPATAAHADGAAAAPASHVTAGSVTASSVTAGSPLATVEFGLLGAAAVLGIGGATGLYLTRSHPNRTNRTNTNSVGRGRR